MTPYERFIMPHVHDPERPPILVIIKDGIYQCYGEPTPRSEEIVRLFKEMGGPAANTPDGRYHFNIEIIEGLNAYAVFEPAP